MSIFDYFIPERDIWKERENCRVCGTIDITIDSKKDSIRMERQTSGVCR